MTASQSTAAQCPPRLRIWLLLVNFVPLLHVLVLARIAFIQGPVWVRIVAVLAALYGLPPLASRLVQLCIAIPEGRIGMGTPAFLGWWATAQLQMIFNRLPLLEELLRIVPGLYSNWLRLWGSRIGRLTFWAPGVAVLDRGYLDIGDDVLFGAGVRLNGHVLLHDKNGAMELALGRIRIGSGAFIGGYSLLTAGTEIAPGDTTHAYLLSPPFTAWREGKRWKRAGGNS
jgi:hypothetical protein